MDYTSVQELISLAGNRKISDIVIECQARAEGLSQAELIGNMRERLHIMKGSISAGLQPDLRSNSGLVGGQAARLSEAVRTGITFGGSLMGTIASYALAVAECNACMGRIVAAPTAGSCGILPSVLFCAQEQYHCSDDDLVHALFTAAGVGQIIAARASISGAEGGCQAECGTAAAMAAAALVELRDGHPAAYGHAVAFVLMNMMGLVCDPLNGLVEIPCVYRNVSGAANAVVAADMALAGLTSKLPADGLIDAMDAVGRSMPESLRETGIGGCASCHLNSTAS